MSASREKKKRQTVTDADMTQAHAGQKGMSKTTKTALSIVAAILVVAIIVFFALVSTGFFVTNTVAATVGGHTLSPAMVNYFFYSAYQQVANTYGDYLGMFIDTTKPLDEQAYMSDEFDTWYDYLLDSALKGAHEVYAIYDEAVANDFALSQESLDAIDNEIAMLDVYGAMNGYTNGQAYLAANYGTGSTIETYREYLTLSMTASEYSQQMEDSFTYTADDISAYYEEHTDDFDGVNFRVYSINVPTSTDEEEEEVDTEAALAECETKAKEMAEASQGDEQAYLDYTVEYADEDSKETYEDDTATLREDYTISSCDELYRDWLADDARQAGDTTYIANGETGYYVLYYIGQYDRTISLPNVRHILVSASDTSDEKAMAEAKAEAQQILDDFLAGDATEESFGALADEKSADSPEGGLYENVLPGYMEQAFEDWCFDASRQPGDTGIVETSYGYHVMYFCGYGSTYRDYLVESTLRTNDYNAWEEGVVGEVSYTTNSFGMRFTSK